MRKVPAFAPVFIGFRIASEHGRKVRQRDLPRRRGTEHTSMRSKGPCIGRGDRVHCESHGEGRSMKWRCLAGSNLRPSQEAADRGRVHFPLNPVPNLPGTTITALSARLGIREKARPRE